MHIGAAVEPANLGLVPAFVVIVADVARLVEILDAMEQEAERKPTFFDRLALILHDQPKLVDFVDDATLRGNVATALGVVLGLIQWNIDVMPRGRLGQSPAMLVRPKRGIRQRLARLQQRSNRGLCLGRHVLLGEPGNYTMPERSPRPDGRCHLKYDEQAQGDDETRRAGSSF